MKWLMFFAGLCISMIPLYSLQHASSTGQKYVNQFERLQIPAAEYAAQMQMAHAYNQALLVQQTSGVKDQILDRYEDILNFSGMMALLEIPALDLFLPVFHGTDDKTLAMGVGHMEGTSLPAGGSGTTCVLASHSGPSTTGLFANLDKLKTGDVIRLHLPEETLVYGMQEAEIVLPSETGAARIVQEEDLLKLITCTPYGINSHRLVVTASRAGTDDTGKEEPAHTVRTEWLWPGLFTAAWFLAGRLKRKERKR